MKQLLLFLALLLTAASCGKVQPPLQPPAEPPLSFRYQHLPGAKLYFWPSEAYKEARINTYVEDLDGRWRIIWYGVNPELATKDSPHQARVYSLSTDEGYLIHYGLWKGRRLFWKYRFKVHTDQEPWRFEAPVGEVILEELERFPWEPQYPTDPWDDHIWGYLNTAAMGGPFIGCLQQDIDKYLRRGIFIVNQPATATRWWDLGQLGPTNFTYRWSWIDGVREGFLGVEDLSSGSFFVTNGMEPPFVSRFPSLDNRTHEVILLGRTDGVGPRSVEAWEQRYYRLAGRNTGGFEEPDGSVRCERGEWRFDEITDPAAIAWLESWRNNTMPPVDPLTPEQKAWLWPAEWQ